MGPLINLLKFHYCEKRKIMLNKIIEETKQTCKRYTMIVTRFFKEHVLESYELLGFYYNIPSIEVPDMRNSYDMLKPLVTLFRTVELKEKEKLNKESCAICLDKLILEKPDEGYEAVRIK